MLTYRLVKALEDHRFDEHKADNTDDDGTIGSARQGVLGIRDGFVKWLGRSLESAGQALQSKQRSVGRVA